MRTNSKLFQRPKQNSSRNVTQLICKLWAVYQHIDYGKSQNEQKSEEDAAATTTTTKPFSPKQVGVS
jgi:hypothetical protein